jgi:hypothetical protein
VARLLTGTLIFILLVPRALAADSITAEQIQQVINATDAAARNRNAAGIGVYLSNDFEKIIEFPYEKWMAKVRLDKDKYLELIDGGWETTEEYDYQRDDTVIHIMPDGLSGQSYSTVIENITQDGDKMISKFREHALYALENGRPVITQISGHTLLGDTTPVPGE